MTSTQPIVSNEYSPYLYHSLRKCKHCHKIWRDHNELVCPDGSGNTFEPQWKINEYRHTKEYCTAWRNKNKEALARSHRKYYLSEKGKAKRLEIRARNKDRLREQNWAAMLYSQYRIRPEQYWGMAKEQNYCCALCLKALDFSVKRPPVDHDHATGKVRGILHHSCNHGIGEFRDDVEALRLAIAYLEKHK